MNQTAHCRAHRPAAFTPAERETVEILFGGLHWRAERLIQAVFENPGYRALPTASRDDLLAGRERADGGQCGPTSFTTGNLTNFLKSEATRIGAEETAKRYVYVTAGSCASCRFGPFHQRCELALRNIGMDAFRMFLIA